MLCVGSIADRQPSGSSTSSCETPEGAAQSNDLVWGGATGVTAWESSSLENVLSSLPSMDFALFSSLDSDEVALFSSLVSDENMVSRA